jgi:hypothetical protein
VRSALVALLAAVLGGGAVAGCAARATAPSRPVESPSAGAATVSDETAVCAVDSLRSVRARFRATVVTADGESVADGVLLVRRPGALRVKLFGLAGFTVHDATWNGDGTRVRGRVGGFGRDEPDLLVQTPDRPIEDPAARLSLVLWSLWQARCGRPPTAVGSAETYGLDPGPAQVRAREVDVVSGEVRAERLRWSSDDEIEVRYRDYDRTLAVALPRRIEFTMPGADWTAEVQVSEYVLNEDLPAALFELPAERTDRPVRGAHAYVRAASRAP